MVTVITVWQFICRTTRLDHLRVAPTVNEKSHHSSWRGVAKNRYCEDVVTMMPSSKPSTSTLHAMDYMCNGKAPQWLARGEAFPKNTSLPSAFYRHHESAEGCFGVMTCANSPHFAFDLSVAQSSITYT